MKSARVAPLVLVLSLTGIVLTPGRASDQPVGVKDNYFAPVRTVIFVGDTVTWNDSGDQPHTVTSFDGTFDSSPNWTPFGAQGPCQPGLVRRDDCMRDGDRYLHRFSYPGTYFYYCRLHGTTASKPSGTNAKRQPCGMCGQIVVMSKTSSSPTVRRTQTTRPSTSTSASAKASVSASPRTTGAAASPSASQSGVAAAASPGGGLGEAGRLTAATVAVVALIAAGYATWRRFLHYR